MADIEKVGPTHVIVACKIAVPWIDLQCCEERIVSENTQTGPREIKQYAKTGPIVRIRGAAYPRGEAPEGFPDKPEMIAGYALTRGVDKDFWDKWVKQHAKAPYVISGMIMAWSKEDNLKDAVKERKGELSGLEPIARNKTDITDARLPRSINPQVTAPQPGTRTAA